MMMCPCPVRMEGVGRGLRTFAKPHQGVWGSVGGGAEHVLLRSTTRPVSLDTTNTCSLPSFSCLLSLSVRTPRCPPLARARPQATRTPCTRRGTRVFWPVGLLLGCCSCERWAGAGGQGGREGDLPLDKTMRGVMKRMCLSTQSVLSASPASIATFSSASPSVLRAAVLVVAHLQPQLKLHLQHPSVASHRSVIRRPRRGAVIRSNKSQSDFRSCPEILGRLRVTCDSSRTLRALPTF